MLGINSQYKVAIVAPTCFYYQVPLFRALANHPRIKLTVYFCSDEGIYGRDILKKFRADDRWGVEDELLTGFPFKVLPNYSPWPSYLRSALGLLNFGIWNEIKRNRPSAVVLMGWSNATWWIAVLACLRYKVPFFYMTDSNAQIDLAQSKWKAWPKKLLLGKLLFRLTAGFLCAGTANRVLYRYYGVPEKKLIPFAFSWGYEAHVRVSDELKSQRTQIRSQLGIAENSFVILFCGRLSKEKGLLRLLEAYNSIDQRDKTLVVVGDGGLRGPSQDYVARNNVASVRFFGFQNRKAISKFYAISDILVLPSERETWGIVVNEALSFGLPVIVSDRVGAGPDLVRHGYNGFIFPRHDTTALANHIKELSELPQHERSIMGSRSLNILKDWTQRDLAEPLLQYLDSLGHSGTSHVEKNLSVLLFTRYYAPGYRAGGPIRALVNLVGQLGNEFTFNIVTTDRDSGDTAPYSGVVLNVWNQVGKAKVRYLSPRSRSFAGLRRLLRSSDYDLVHFTGSFSPTFTIKVLLLRRLGLTPKKPVIVAPRGELSSGALSLKRFKKRLYLQVAKLLGLYQNVIWHASSDHEVEDIRREFGLHANIVLARDLVVPSQARNRMTKLSGKVQGRLNIVFLSRVSEMKNLLGALKILHGLKGQVHLNIYGPIEDRAYWQKCQKQIEALPANVTAIYCGTVPPDEVEGVFGQHDLHLLPTLGENFGHVVFESLTAGCPVLVSDQTGWQGLEEAGAGWALPLGDMARFQQVLQKCIEMGPEEWEVLSSQAQQYALQFSEHSSALQANRSLLKGKGE
jgi:glycosyltransferase involved in cell wall biosynthesis